MIDGAAQYQEGSSQLKAWLSSFSCQKDKDIEDFLRDRAIMFETIHKSRTYFILDEALLRAEGRIQILGFFTVSLKVLDIPEVTSKRKRLAFDGFSSKLHGEPIKSIPCYLIGQLAKNSAAENAVDGDVLLNGAISVIKSAMEDVGGRFVLIECRDHPRLRKFYTDNGFEEFETIPYENTPMVQMIRPLY